MHRNFWSDDTTDEWHSPRTGWRSLLEMFDWDGLRAEVDRESRARIAIVGLGNAGKSTLFNCLRGWVVSPPTLKIGRLRHAVEEDMGLFTLVDLPDTLYDEPAAQTDESGWGEAPLTGGDLLLRLAEMDLIIFVLDGAAGLRPADYRWFCRLRATGCPLVTVLNKADLLAGTLPAVLADLEQRLAAPVTPVSALKGADVEQALLKRILDVCPTLSVPLGRELARFRCLAAGRVIRRAALFTGLVGAEPIPLLDVPVQLLVQVSLVLRIAAIYGQPPTDNQRKELIVAVASGLGLRYLGQQLAKLTPVLGWAVSGLLSAATTWLLGQAAVRYYELDADQAWERWWRGLRARLSRRRRGGGEMIWRRRRERETSVEAIFSPEALRRAWLAVRRAGGGPGVDGVSILRFERDLDRHLTELRTELVAGTYRPRPVLRVLVPKPDGGLRPLAMWTLRDRVAQRAVHDYLEPIVERLFLDCSYGFRPGRSVADAVAAVLTHRDAGRRWVVDADIRDCFGTMDTRLLRRMVREVVPEQVVVTLIDHWLDARIFNPLRGRRTRAQASQGGVISPLLCNLYLHRFDVALTKRGLHLVRFADDFVILCRRRREAARALTTARRALAKLRLELNHYKTRLVHFNQGFAFLGVFFLRDEHFYL